MNVQIKIALGAAAVTAVAVYGVCKKIASKKEFEINYQWTCRHFQATQGIKRAKSAKHPGVPDKAKKARAANLEREVARAVVDRNEGTMAHLEEAIKDFERTGI